MGFESTRLGIVDAQKISDQVWELILSNWGNHGTDGCVFANPPPPALSTCADPYALIYPARASDAPLPSISGLAISPRSDADRVVVSYVLNPLDPRPHDGIEELEHNEGHMANFDQLISVDRTWSGGMNGPIVIRASGNQWFGDEYIPADGGGVVAPFGTTMTNPNIPSRIFDAPTLRLLLFLQGSTPPSPFRRSPYHFAELLSPSNVAGAAAKTIVKVIPVMGRRSISVMLRGATTGGGSSVNVTVGGVNAGASERQIAFAAIEPATECVLIPQVSLTVGGTYKATFTDPQVQYLTFYVQRVGAASEDGVYVTVDAVD